MCNPMCATAQRMAELEQRQPDSHGFLFLNPDAGFEWSENHPVESGEAPDAEDVRPATAEELHNALMCAWEQLSQDEWLIVKARKRNEELEAENARLREALTAMQARWHHMIGHASPDVWHRLNEQALGVLSTPTHQEARDAG